MSAVPSPCVNVCRLDPGSGLCQGCLRNLDEIARWGSASDAERQAILRRVARRRAAPDTWPGTRHGEAG